MVVNWVNWLLSSAVGVVELGVVEGSADEEHSESVVIGIGETSGDTPVEFNEIIDSLGTSV